MGPVWTRRDLLENSGAGLIAALPHGFDALLPPQAKALLPPDARDAVELAGELLELEREAEALRLPRSILSIGSGAIPANPARLYELAMPRLVALVDRSERKRPVFARRAGALLARLHQGEHTVPAAWGEMPAAAPAPRPLSLAPGPDAVIELPKAAVELPEPEAPPPESLLSPVIRSHQFGDLASEYPAWFAAASLRPEHQQSADWHLAMMRSSKDRYAEVGKPLGVPWQFIAAVHGLEASFNFLAHLHNGDFPLTRRTRQVPAGRPLVWLPPSSWEASATDALKLMGYAHQADWSLARMLYRLEAYNGFGYRLSGRASPYLWSFSNLYSSGKFVADGHFDPKARSHQCGAGVMLKLLDLASELDLRAV